MRYTVTLQGIEIKMATRRFQSGMKELKKNQYLIRPTQEN